MPGGQQIAPQVVSPSKHPQPPPAPQGTSAAQHESPQRLVSVPGQQPPPTQVGAPSGQIPSPQRVPSSGLPGQVQTVREQPVQGYSAAAQMPSPQAAWPAAQRAA